MDLNGIGYSNIRLPNSTASYIYTYNRNTNIFPEEVFVHEFLHTLERILKERNYNIPALHDNEKYGYKEERTTGLRKWYRDYMLCNINGEKKGLDNIVYTLTPPAESDFEYSKTVSFSKQQGNSISKIFKSIIYLFKGE